jgi:hypothetical protein
MSWSDKRRGHLKRGVTPPAPVHNERYRTPGGFLFLERLTGASEVVQNLVNHDG